MSTPATARLRQPKPWLTKRPNASQEKILRALQASKGPISSAELSKRVALATNDARGHCVGLLKKELVASQKRVVRRSVGGLWRRNPELFWSLTDKGIEYLATKKI